MRAKGISYETGWVRGGVTSHEAFDPAVVERELRIVRDDLHCTAVRVLGGDPRRLELAASCAADLGLEVWFSPYPLESTPEEILALFADCAERAERLRRRGAEVVFVTGAELSLMGPGFLPGDTVQERIRSLAGSPRGRELIAELGVRINEFLGRAAVVVRERFGGRVTYAAVPVERVDWAPFDIVSVDRSEPRRPPGAVPAGSAPPPDAADCAARPAGPCGRRPGEAHGRAVARPRRSRPGARLQRACRLPHAPVRRLPVPRADGGCPAGKGGVGVAGTR